MKTDARDHLGYLVENFESISLSVQPLWHPLGFVSCVIREKSDGVTVRVHYWPPGERRTKNPDWPIHTHSYTLSSLILHGKLEDVQCEMLPGSDYVVYEVAYRNGDSEIIRTGDGLSIAGSKSIIRKAGEQYRVDRGVFHQSRVDFNESTITLVAMSNFSNEPPLVLGGNGNASYPYDRTPFCREIFWASVRHALEGASYSATANV